MFCNDEDLRVWSLCQHPHTVVCCGRRVHKTDERRAGVLSSFYPRIPSLFFSYKIAINPGCCRHDKADETETSSGFEDMTKVNVNSISRILFILFRYDG